MVKTRAGTDLQSNKRTAANKKGKAVQATITKSFRYPRCSRHPRGGVKCVACMRAGHTKASWKRYITKAQKPPRAGTRAKAVPVIDTRRRRAPPKR